MRLQKIHYILIVCMVFYSIPFLFSTKLTVSDEVDYYYEEYFPSPRRKRCRLPTFIDDLWRYAQRCWKKYRKTQYKIKQI